MEVVELNPLTNSVVGLPGVDGLSTEHRERLTIAVELVANPSIIFMDEPTLVLDARAAAIVMRTLLLMKKGGQVIYAGPLGHHSRLLIEYKLQDLLNLLGAMYAAVMFLGGTNTSAVQSVVAVERTVFYRERAAGMYSALPYAFAQQIPIWWRWYYWGSPVAWTIYGLLTSQVGDRKDNVEVPGVGEIPLKLYLKEYLGFEYDFLGVVAVAWAVLFFFVFAYGIKFLNFQRR
ncbi:hypothetical protein RND71_028926 [Anisodus tanguticus]|uniref:ABC-2 type transporter transmembrane domain-containing protein n=1 Tax=Anisodus tanguticus TaxID=243964 RepID=A0AAE1V234_9SOLA|nr:hypothetical protein RND71_028926 [Anisodus tanguticus]